MLAIKIVETNGDDSETFWETFQISSTGILDWDSGTFGSGIAKTEESFNQDLNNDGTTGIKVSVLQTSVHDTVGEKLKKDSENGLYISDPKVANVIPIVDDSGAPVLFDFNDTWSEGSFNSVSHAVEKQDSGNYKIAIKGTETNEEGDSEKTYTNWQTFTISSCLLYTSPSPRD